MDNRTLGVGWWYHVDRHIVTRFKLDKPMLVLAAHANEYFDSLDAAINKANGFIDREIDYWEGARKQLERKPEIRGLTSIEQHGLMWAERDLANAD
jgi:hypothetical protein